MFTADDLLTLAKARYGESVLRQRVAPRASDDDKDVELLTIARSVLSRVQEAAQGSIGWPLPGRWPAGSADASGNPVAGEPYSDLWPDDLVQRALELFDFRTYAGFDVIPTEKRLVAQATEKFFANLASGAVGLAIGGGSDLSPAALVSARDRFGRSLIAGGGFYSRNVLDEFRGPWWDWT